MHGSQIIEIGELQSYIFHFEEVEIFKTNVYDFVKKNEGSVRFGFPSGGKEDYKNIDDIPFPIKLTGRIQPNDIAKILGIDFKHQGDGHYKASHSISCDVVDHNVFIPQEIKFEISYWFEDEIGGCEPD